jgi:hypothetical protein
MPQERGTPIGLESKIVRRQPLTADMTGSCVACALLAAAPHEAIDMRLPELTGEDWRAL